MPTVIVDPPTETPTPTPAATVIATPPAVLPPTPTPAATATPGATLPVFQLSASGKRSVRVRVRCPKACVVTAGLTVDARTARRLGLGGSRSAGSLRRSLKPGSTTLTVTLGSRARRGVVRIKSFRATLSVRSGSVVKRRQVTIKR